MGGACERARVYIAAPCFSALFEDKRQRERKETAEQRRIQSEKKLVSRTVEERRLSILTVRQVSPHAAPGPPNPADAFKDCFIFPQYVILTDWIFF